MFKGDGDLPFVEVRAKKSPSSNSIDIRLVRKYFDILLSFKVQDSVKVNSIEDAFNCEASISVHMMCCSQVYEGKC